MILLQKMIYRMDLRANQGKAIYLFGDNLLRVGMGGQAKEMRGEPNAIGIPTKRRGSMDDDAFFSDATLEANIQAIIVPVLEALKMACAGYVVVVPMDGLGTGLAMLPERAPVTADFLDDCIVMLGKARPGLHPARLTDLLFREWGISLSVNFDDWSLL